MMVRLEYAYGVCPKCKVNNYLRYIIHNDGLVHKPYEIKCLNCNSYFEKEDIFGSGEKTKPKPTTNYDLLHAMSMEELAYFIAEPSVAPPPWCKEIPVCPHLDEDIVPCHECALNWLKQEADNGRDD